MGENFNPELAVRAAKRANKATKDAMELIRIGRLSDASDLLREAQNHIATARECIGEGLRS